MLWAEKRGKQLQPYSRTYSLSTATTKCTMKLSVFSSCAVLPRSSSSSTLFHNMCILLSPPKPHQKNTLAINNAVAVALSRAAGS